METQKYQITILGSLNKTWVTYFSGMTMTDGPTGTVLAGQITDQAALHGILNRIRDMNLKLVSVQLIDKDNLVPVECLHCPFRTRKGGNNENAVSN